MKKVMFIANRNAGKGKAFHILRQARRSFWGWDCDYNFTASPKETIQACKNLDPKKHEAVFLVGGDGTLNQALPALVGNKVPLGLIPAGTANDLSRKLGNLLDWDLIQQLIDRNATDQIDVVEVNGHPFVTIGGIGIGAHVTKEFNEKRQTSPVIQLASKLFHSQIYTGLSIKTILFNQSFIHHVEIETPELSERVKSGAIFIANQSTLGKDISVAPSSLINDEMFDVMILQGTSRKQLLSSLQSFKKGIKPRGATCFSTNQMTITSLDKKEISVFGDGEYLTKSIKLNFKILPGALKVYRQEKLLNKKGKRLN